VIIDVYDILRSKEDKATVPIYYEALLAKFDLKPVKARAREQAAAQAA
jgi:type I site-specific restriction-modification system R (restriction) subunit